MKKTVHDMRYFVITIFKTFNHLIYNFKITVIAS